MRTRKQPTKELLLKVATLHHVERWSKKQIAEHLGVGTKQIPTFLEESVRWLLEERLQFAANAPSETARHRLEQALVQKYSFLKKVKVLDTLPIKTETDYFALMRRWDLEAANYFDELVNDKRFRDEDGVMHVSVSGGELHLELMSLLPDRPRSDVRFYASAFLGRPLHEKFHVDPATNATIAWLRSGRLRGNCVYATVSPCDLGSRRNDSLKERKKAVKTQLDALACAPAVKKVIQQLDKVRVTIAGIGMVTRAPGSLRMYEPTASELLITQGINPSDLTSDGAVGDISYNFFRADGSGLQDRFFVSAGYHSGMPGANYYRRMVDNKEKEQRVIVLAGPFKFKAILAALRGRLFNVWFTDEHTANQILAAK